MIIFGACVYWLLENYGLNREGLYDRKPGKIEFFGLVSLGETGFERMEGGA